MSNTAYIGLFIEDYMKTMVRRSGMMLPEIIKFHPTSSADAIQTANMVRKYYGAGQQMVKISEDMYELLLRTDMKGVTAEDLKLPYECLGFIMPHPHTIEVGPNIPPIPTNTVYLRSRFEGEIPSEISQRLGLDGAHLILDPDEIGRLMEQKGVTQEEINESLALGFLVFVGAMHGEYAATSWVGFGKKELDRAASGSGESLEDIITEKVDTVEQVSGNRTAYLTKKTAEDDFFKAMKVAMNAIVYLNHGLDSKLLQRRDDEAYREYTRLFATTNSESKRRTYGRKVTKIARPTVRVLGPNIKRGALNTQSATDVIVRGHWHTYWVGKGRETRKLNWVHPYVRNKDKGIVPDKEPRTYEI